MVLELLSQSLPKKQGNWTHHINEATRFQFLEMHSPRGLDLSKSTSYPSQAALWGIEVVLGEYC